ncbi:cytochrome P450 [Hypoxylon crocopeplum]|nr:cytochrome P450 [Hypoxylon crocopeplum]
MSPTILLVLWFLISWVGYKQLANWLRWRALRNWGIQNGCQDITKSENTTISSIKKYFLVFNGDLNKRDFFEEFVRAPFEKIGGYTYRSYGLFDESHILTADPANIQAVLSGKFQDYELGPKRKRKYEGLLGDGIFTSEGEQWRHFRGQLKPFFSKDLVGELDAASKHLDILLRALPMEDPQGWVHQVDIMPMLLNFTMDSSTEFLFGLSLNSQSTTYGSNGTMEKVNEYEKFAQAMDEALEYAGRRFKLELPSWLLPSPKEYKEACKTVQEFTQSSVQMALQQADRKVSNGDRGEKNTILLHELATSTRDPVELGQQVLHLLAAGRETTAAAIAYSVMLLGRHPAEYARLRDIVLAHFGPEDAPTQDVASIAALRACKPLQDVVYEALRLYPAIAVSSRVAKKDTVLPTGGGSDGRQPFAVRRGEEVKYAAYVMHRRHDIWGADADEFRPRRWETRKLGSDIIPFSIGPRTCIGNQFALNQATFVLAKLALRYDRIEHAEADQPITSRVTAILMPTDGVRIRFHRANSGKA